MKAVHLSASLSRNAGGLYTSVRLLCQSLSKRDEVDISVAGLRDERTDEDLQEWLSLKPIVCTVRGPRHSITHPIS